MRKELYELYKEQHPEELHEVNATYGYSQAVESRRTMAREDKVRRIARWKEILANENREETENGEGETGSGS